MECKTKITMREKRFLNLLVTYFLFIPAFLNAQKTGNSCINTEFDFWLGNWKIEQEILTGNGNVIKLKAGCIVKKELNNCLITESWNGDVQFFWEGMTMPENISAYSVRSFNYTDSTWSIYWADTRSRGLSAPYKGKFTNGAGEFYKTEGGVKTRIVFSNITDASVDWELSVFQPEAGSWLVLWKMRFTRID
jgi:hypothetical protein